MLEVVVHSGTELFDELSEAERSTLLWRWRQAVASALGLPVQQIAALWYTWALAQNMMDDIKILVPVVPKGLPEGTAEKICTELRVSLTTNAADILRGRNFAVKVWVQTSHGVLYDNCWVEPNPESKPLQGDPCPNCHVIGARILATAEQLSDAQGTCENCGNVYRP